MKSPRLPSSVAFTLIEIIVVVSITLVLATLVVMAAPAILQRANLTKCASNLRNIWQAELGYASDNSGQFAPNAAGSAVFAGALRPYVGEENLTGAACLRYSIFVCPGDKYPLNQPIYYIGNSNTGYALSYAQNGYIGLTSSATYSAAARFSGLTRLSQLAVLMDYENHYIATMGTWNVGTRLSDLSNRHNGQINVVFADGHASPMWLTNVDTNVPNAFWQGR